MQNMEQMPDLNSLKYKIEDACNQFTQFRFRTADEVREILHTWDFKTLEECVGKTTEEIEAMYPYACAVYNDLIQEFQRGEFNDVRLEEIMQEAHAVTHQK
jgi:hypothetical protein